MLIFNYQVMRFLRESLIVSIRGDVSQSGTSNHCATYILWPIELESQNPKIVLGFLREILLVCCAEKDLTAQDMNHPTNDLTKYVSKLSDQGLLNILRKEWITLWGDESREELEAILKCNLEDDLIDEVEIILELSGE